MFFEPRIRLPDLAALCRRLATQLAAGVDVRRVWSREAEGARGAARWRYRQISELIDRGDSLSESMAATGEFFPSLTRELVEVGEKSGHLAEVFRQLARHYDHQIRLRRDFRRAITWPAIQLFIALMIVAALIWAMGFIAELTNSKPMDMLGLGLYGTPGVIKYFTFLAAIGAACWALLFAVRRGVLWARPLQLVAMRIPKIGRALETLAMSRLCWSLHVTFESGMPLQQALELALKSTQNYRYTREINPIWSSIRRGSELFEAMEATHVFPRSLTDAIEVGERSGRMSETLTVLSEQYQEEAQSALAILTQIAGMAVWAMVAGLIISIIFRVFGTYARVLNDAASGKF